VCPYCQREVKFAATERDDHGNVVLEWHLRQPGLSYEQCRGSFQPAGVKVAKAGK
jgi:hypothetical protein